MKSVLMTTSSEVICAGDLTPRTSAPTTRARLYCPTITRLPTMRTWQALSSSISSSIRRSSLCALRAGKVDPRGSQMLRLPQTRISSSNQQQRITQKTWSIKLSVLKVCIQNPRRTKWWWMPKAAGSSTWCQPSMPLTKLRMLKAANSPPRCIFSLVKGPSILRTRLKLPECWKAMVTSSCTRTLRRQSTSSSSLSTQRQSRHATSATWSWISTAAPTSRLLTHLTIVRLQSSRRTATLKWGEPSWVGSYCFTFGSSFRTRMHLNTIAVPSVEI